MTLFQVTTAVARSVDGSFEANIDDAWGVFRGPHGGYLTAILLRAMTESVGDSERPIRSMTTHFVGPPKPGPVEIRTVIERSGRNTTFVSARLTQGGATMATSLGAFSRPWNGMHFEFAPPPDVPGPDDCTQAPATGPMLPAFLANFDMRWGIGSPPYSGVEDTTVGGWLRLREPQEADAPAVACLLDAWAPAILPRATSPMVAPTIDITMHFREALPRAGVAPDDFFLFRLTSRVGRDGFFEEDGDLWAPDGTLIAHCRQLAIALPVNT